ncbi:hypothetical protein MWU60_14820 [Yoonia sp. F2084L]|uniref:lysophospholipid acyltransferase family protein n=1 Tax=Yoonia sp. F2084L TaxID=2926419 RepID=UPI001FF1C1E8|nr:hypothetical protein [Yoonia sp. F2084L]MCK0096849.1 hypothetical protein [Yoonia sp. F2084L]
MSLRKRIEKSTFLANVLARLAGTYLSFCQRTTTWQSEGVDDLRAAMAEGPVLLVMWHSRLMMSAYHWPIADGTLSSLHDTSPIGRVVGVLHTRAGLRPMKMSRKTTNIAASRTVLKRVKEGVSIGMTGDGPLGPARQVNDATLEWARVTGIPVFGYAFTTTKERRLDSWDQMLVPKPFGKGAYVFRRFDDAFPRKPTADEQEALRQSLQDFLNKVTRDADQLLGLPEGP